MAKEKVYLFDHSPHLRDEWDYEKNVGVDPDKLTHASSKKVFWLCVRGHRWEASVPNRTIRNSGCPYCSNSRVLRGFNDLSTSHPSLSASLVDPVVGYTVSSGSMKKVEWICSDGHVWTASVKSRAINETGCPYCSGSRVLKGLNDLATTDPEIAEELKYSEYATKLSRGSTKKVWWACANNHQWEVSVNSRFRGATVSGCPFCTRSKILTGFNDLGTTHPELALELSSPSEARSLAYGSTKKVLWKCGRGHEWAATVGSRAVSQSGCPKCCNSHTSKAESRLRVILSDDYSIAAIDHSHRIPLTWGRESTMSVDMELVLSGTSNCIVEYDGCYWHKNKATKDTQKTELILGEGYLVVRLREQSGRIPLPHLDIQHPNLLQLSVPYSKTDEHLIEAVEKIKDWLDAKQQEKTL